MSRADMGVPDLKVRVDDSETARQWNRVREGVMSLANSATPFERGAAVPQINGFQPIALRYYEDPTSLDEYEAGVGLSVGRLVFLQGPSITVNVGDDQEAVELVPKLEEVKLDAEITPRKPLSDGDWEAWVIYRELPPEHEAHIVFSELGTGPEPEDPLDPDEKAVRLATFKVVNNTADLHAPPLVHVYKHFIRDSYPIPTDYHQFRVYKSAEDKVKVTPGWVIFPAGRSDPLVAGSGYDITQETSEHEETITQAGSLFFKIHWTVTQLSTSEAGDHTLVVRRLYSISTPVVEFRAVTDPYTIGDDDATPWTDGYMYYEICKLSFANGETFVTDQILNGPLHLLELNDAVLSGGS